MHIYVTSIGSLSALGDQNAARRAYRDGVCALRPRSVGHFCVALGSIDAACEARIATLAREDRAIAQLDRSVQLAVLATRDALDAQAKRPESPRPSAVFFGSSRGATNLLETAHGDFLVQGRVPPRTSPSTTLGNLASNVARYGMRSCDARADDAFELSSACSSSFSAIQLAVAWLRAGLARACLAGGAESALTPFTLAQLAALGLLNRRQGEPAPCRPLALDSSNTMALAEGACALVLERMTRADARARSALAEIGGIGSSIECAASPTGISPNGDALLRSMRAACAELTGAPDAVVVHAPGTARGDRAELAAIRALFGDDGPALCSNKWLLGHTFGASGALSIELALALLEGVVPAAPPYASFLTQPKRPVRSVLVNAMGFGGLALSVLLRATES